MVKADRMVSSRLRALFWFLTVLLFSSCGGGGNGGGGGTTPPTEGDFSISASNNPVILVEGTGNGEQINFSPVGNFSGLVTFSVNGVPAGVTVSPANATFQAGGTSGFGALGLSFVAAATAPITSATVTVTATSGSLSHSVSFTLEVTAPSSIQLTLSPSSISIGPNQTVSVGVSYSGTLSPGVSTVEISTPLQIPNEGITTSGGPILSPSMQQGNIQITSSTTVTAATNLPITVTGTAGSVIVSATLSLTVTNPYPSTGPASRSTFRRTDDDPTGAIYDPAHKQVFTAVNQLNQVVVYSSTDAHTIATLSVPVPRGIDIAADGTEVIVGSDTNSFFIINPATLQITQRVVVPDNYLPGPPQITAPMFPVTLADGKILFMMDGSVPVLWNPATQTYTSFLTAGPDGGVISFARSADHTTVAMSGQSNIVLFSSSTDNVVGQQNFNIGYGTLAVNRNGTQLAALTGSSSQGGSQITLFDSSFDQLATVALNSEVDPTGLIYSRDGTTLYAVTDSALVIVMNAQTLAIEGMVPSYGGFLSNELQPDIDETGMIFAPVGEGMGIAFVDASSPRALGADEIYGAHLNPPYGTTSSPGTSTLTVGGELTQNSQIFFGAAPGSPEVTPARNVTLQLPTAAQLTPPPAQQSGPVNVTVTNPDGWLSIGPDAYTYGVDIVSIAPSAGPQSGGTTVTLRGYGLAYEVQQSSVGVTVGGQTAAVIDVFDGIDYSPYPFPLDTVKFTAPASQTAGPADVVVTTPTGTATAKGAFQYLQSVQIANTAGALAQVVYDRPRQRLYASNYNLNQVAVYDLQQQKFLAPIAVGNGPAGISLTPDGTILAVTNTGDGTLSLINPAALSVSGTADLSSQFTPSGGCYPLAIATTSTNSAVIQITCPSMGTGYFIVLNLATGTFGCGTSNGCASMLRAFQCLTLNISASQDGNKVFATYGTYLDGELPIAVWDVAADSYTSGISYSFQTSVVDADGTLYAADNGAFGPDMSYRNLMQDLVYLQAGSSNFQTLPGEVMHPSGSLIFQPETSGIDVFDTLRGRLDLRIDLPFTVGTALDSMAIDETGSRLFIITTDGLAVVQIAQLPLSIGTLTPSSGPASGGTTVTIRGSGFVNGTTVLFGSASASTSFVDTNTLKVTTPPTQPGPQRVTVTNPDGTNYSYDAGFSSN